jgi:hypothetical protein
LGYAVGLILSFAGASLAFGLSLVKDDSYVPSCWSKAFVMAYIVSFLLSLVFGIWCVVNRLRDFRKTRSIARDREEWARENVSEPEIEARLAIRRDETDKLGKTTWRLFWVQIGAFSSGVIFLSAAFGMAYHSKLF